MPDEAPAIEQDTPITDAPVEGSAEPTQAEVDWSKRYADLQPEYTRATQEAATLREQNQAWQVLTTSDDPEQRSLAAEILGIELEQEDTEEQDFLDPTDELRKELSELKAWKDSLTESQQAEQQAIQEAEFIDSQLVSLEGTIGRKFEDDEAKLIASLAFVNRDDKGQPNVQAAFDSLSGFSKAEFDRIKKGKKAPQAPGGQAAGERPDLSTRQARENRLLQLMEASQHE